MTKEEKDLLLKYLCMALPYGVICTDSRHGDSKITEIDVTSKTVYCDDFDEYASITTVRPYLRPVSSMTDEEKSQMTHDCYVISLDFEQRTTDMVALWNTPRVIIWFLEHHFDFMNLIPKGLALEAPDGMYNNKMNYD